MSLTMDYVLEPRTAALVRRAEWRIANRCSLGSSDRDDLRQDLYVAVLRRARQFDASRGAASTFVALVVDHHARDVMAHRFAGRRNPRRCASLSEDASAVAGTWESIDRVELRLDVEHALSALDPSTERVAQHFKRGNAADVARWLNLTRGQVRQQLLLLRRRFTELGLAPGGRAVA